MKNIVIFASGSGTNAEQIILHFKRDKNAKIVAILSNNEYAGVLERAKNHQIPSFTFTKTQLNSNFVLDQLHSLKPDLIILSGFLLKFPENILKIYPNKVINIHPALLPNYGGKGMYGLNVHKAVLANKEQYTGITIHYVNEHYDEGAIIKQEKTFVGDCTSPEEIANKVHELEYAFFAPTISEILNE